MSELRYILIFYFLLVASSCSEDPEIKIVLPDQLQASPLEFTVAINEDATASPPQRAGRSWVYEITHGYTMATTSTAVFGKWHRLYVEFKSGETVQSASGYQTGEWAVETVSADSTGCITIRIKRLDGNGAN